MKFLGIILLASQLVGATLVPGTEETYTDGNVMWEGNPWCAELGLFPTAGMVTTDDGNLVDAATIGACRNMRAAVSGAAPDSPITLEIQ